MQLPRDYGVAKQRYPVVVLLDGQVHAFFDMTVAAADYDLTSELHPVGMPRQIVVAVEHVNRAEDLGSNADAFLQFLTTELLPRIDREYRTLAFRTLIGHSRGGGFALRAMCREAVAFPAIIAISPSLPDLLQADVLRCMAGDGNSRTQRHLVVSAGTLEPRALAGTEQLLRSVREQPPLNWRVHQVNASGFEHTGTPLVAIPLGLRFVFGDSAWSLPQPYRDSLSLRLSDPEHTLAAALAEQSVRLGFTIPVSARQLTTVVQTWLARRDALRSVSSAQELLARYPAEILSHTLMADAYDLAGDRKRANGAIQSALDMSRRIMWFDETQKERFQQEMRQLLATRGP